MSSFENKFPKQISCVIVNGDYIPVESVKILNIEKDISGSDLLTFDWEGEERQALVVFKHV